MPMKINPPKTIKPTNQESETGKTDREDKKEFVKQATTHTPLGQVNSDILANEEGQYPWENPVVRKDVTRLFNLRLSEPDWLKLKYIADQTEQSMHAICLDILIPTIHRRLKKLTEKN